MSKQSERMKVASDALDTGEKVMTCLASGSGKHKPRMVFRRKSGGGIRMYPECSLCGVDLSKKNKPSQKRKP